MEGEKQTSAVETQIGQEEKPAETKDVFTKEEVANLIKQAVEEERRLRQSEIKQAVEEERRLRQSEKDVVIAEKRKEVEQKLTLEEQVKQINQRLAEKDAIIARAEYATILPKEKDFYEGVKLYLSSDVQNITKGAELLCGFFEKMKAGYEAEKAKAVQDALVQAGIQKKPITGSTTNTLTLAEFNKLAPKEQADYMAKGGKLQE